MPELKEVAPIKFIVTLSGATPTLTNGANDIHVGDYVIDTDGNPPYVWQCLDEDTPIWIPVESIQTRVQTLTDAATIAVDFNLGGFCVVTLGGNRTLGNPTHLRGGNKYIYVIKQDGTGGRSLAYENLYKFPGGIVPTLTSTANAIDLLEFTSDGTNLYLTDSSYNLS